MSSPTLFDRLQEALASTYTIQRELGGGGMSRVFVAEEKALGRTVVIKVLLPDVAHELSADRFAREIRLAARLQHPNIVPLLSAGHTNGLHYYTMPYVEGESLRARLDRRGALPIQDATEALHDVVRALEYAHAHDVVHRDIKPDNVLMSGNAAAVTDFGIAKAVTAARGGTTLRDDVRMSVTQVGFAIGTPTYMAPEQAAGDPDVDHRADLYAFGCLAYELFVGQPPFTNTTPSALMVAHMTEMPAPLAGRRVDVPRALADLVMHCLAKAPERRPASATEVLAAMDTGIAHARAVTRPSTASIAVLPFDCMSTDKENEYFADGISEEIINALTQLDGLRVAGRTSSFSFKGTKHDLRTIADRLNVNTVLEGSVRRAGNRLRITAQLVNVSDGFHLWSERYDREVIDVFAVQDEIATAIASKLKLALGKNTDDGKRPTNNIEAYELFLKGRICLYRRGRYIRTGIECFERAVSLDNRFAQAHAGLADALSLAAFYGMVHPTDIIGRAHASAVRAVECAPEISESHSALALWMTLYGRDRAGAIAQWERAISIASPPPQVRCIYALWRCGLLAQRWDDAVSEGEQAVAADPLSGYAHSLVALLRMAAQRLDGVVSSAKRGFELDSESFWSTWALQRAYRFAGMYAEAIAQGQFALAMSGRHPWAMGDLAFAYASSGDRAAADALYEELVSRSLTERVQPGVLAFTATSAGRLDEALVHCVQAVDERDAFVKWATIKEYDGWSPLHDHPEWPEVRERILAW